MLLKSNRRQIQLAHDYIALAKACLAEVVFSYMSTGERMALDGSFHELDSAQAKTSNLLAGLYDGSKRKTGRRNKRKE